MSSWVLPIVVFACLWGAAQASNGSNDRIEVPNGPNPRAHSSHPGNRFPNPASAGVPARWKPARTRNADLHVTQPGAVVHDLLLRNADLLVDAPNVTIRRVKLQGGQINNFPGSTCNNGLVIERTTLEPPPGQDSIVESEGAVSYGGYTANRVKIWRRSEGFRNGGRFDGCGPVRIQNSFVKIVIPPGRCDLHADGIQGYDGSALTVTNTTIDFPNCGTAPFFVPSDQGNTSATVNRLLVMGGGYPFRLGVPGRVSGLKIVAGSWVYDPVDVNCSAVQPNWNAQIVKIKSKYEVDKTVRSQPCTGTGN
jgi:hypothetical protein